MEVERDKTSVTVIYRGKKYTVEMSADATVGSLGVQLSELTGVVPRTMRLLLPKGKRSVGRIAIDPSSEPYSSATLEASDITPDVVIRLMGATSEELEQVMRPEKDERILGFAEEESRRKLRRLPLTQVDAKSRLPKGPYTFHDFRTLELPLIQLNPPPEKARALMYRLASDPGIVAIMKKHKWQVGIMTELAPQGYVGVSPKCILGFNKNRGQEISLRLRTDDFQGLRKYVSIKKTLLHELAHMVHDEHDENFHALNKQLNEEAIELDWTSSTGHTLGGEGAMRSMEDDDEPMDAGGVQTGHKLGGASLPNTANARAAAAQAALTRLEESKLASDSAKADALETAALVGTLSISLPSSRPAGENLNEPDPDEKAAAAAADELVVIAEGKGLSDNQKERTEPDPGEATSRAGVHGFSPVLREREPDPDDSLIRGAKSTNAAVEPDPDESRNREEPDPDESRNPEEEPDPDESRNPEEEPDPDESTVCEEPDLGVSIDSEGPARGLDLPKVTEEIARIQDATNALVTRLQHAVSTLKLQASPVEATAALKTLSTIVSNLISNPNDDKYKRLRKGNPRFQDRVGRFEGAVEFLQVVGFSEGESDEGYLVLKRSDPGLLWLARSTLEPLLA